MMSTSTVHAPEVGVLWDLKAAATLRDPERRRLVEALIEWPDSASGLARRLGETRQRLNYHLRALELAGVLELQEERRRGNCMERVLRVKARRFVVDPAALDDSTADPAAQGDRLSASYQIAVAARTIRELASLEAKASEQGKRLATATLDAEVCLCGPAQLEAFVQDLATAVAAAIARHQDEGAGNRPFRVFGGVHPAPQANHEGRDG